mmetsp:Transcript_30713/g.93877  ORF Transcript_30713/g.93877 Transcript_30713/m.93877 type:complete len:209 (+) Transcript_30713:348-974(+)
MAVARRPKKAAVRGPVLALPDHYGAVADVHRVRRLLGSGTVVVDDRALRRRRADGAVVREPRLHGLRRPRRLPALLQARRTQLDLLRTHQLLPPPALRLLPGVPGPRGRLQPLLPLDRHRHRQGQRHLLQAPPRLPRPQPPLRRHRRRHRPPHHLPRPPPLALTWFFFVVGESLVVFYLVSSSWSSDATELLCLKEISSSSVVPTSSR